jgi:hypothetical protein
MQTVPVSWVVYSMPQRHKIPLKVVCEQTEWDAIELGRPGINTLIQKGFATEAAAEQAARGEPAFVPTLWAKWRS